uniref:Phenylcoumaran benzylic ether reductase homolog TH4 n=1 Tax=Tsuga heterophylla TaxID=3359 RepID=Q9M525_TSUHE|nr:phenylcoumaran benzylic ether reductase homolog TH4 [Tsuga heterophylla]
MGSKSRVLIIGGTGYIGRHVAKASLDLGHPTFLLLRESTPSSNSEKAQLVESFKASGAKILHGSIEDHASLVEAVKQVDVVISTVGSLQIENQVNIIKAIKEVGTIKRFLPSEFGNDVDKVHAVEPAKSVFEVKAKVRRAIEAEGIPYTYISSNCFAGYFLPGLGQPGLTTPPRDKIVILGDGNAKVVYAKEEDIGTFTIKAVDDLRTLNKTLYLRLPANTLSFNEVVGLWEKKIDKTLEKVYVPEEGVLKLIADTPFPANIGIAIGHSIFVRGDQTNFEIGADGVEASQLYPEVQYTTVDEYLSKFV